MVGFFGDGLFTWLVRSSCMFVYLAKVVLPLGTTITITEPNGVVGDGCHKDATDFQSFARLIEGESSNQRQQE